MKKNFTGGRNSLLGQNQIPQPESAHPAPLPESDPPVPQPEVSAAAVIKSTQQGTRSGEARATFIVNEATHEKIKAIAYWDQRSNRRSPE